MAEGGARAESVVVCCCWGQAELPRSVKSTAEDQDFGPYHPKKYYHKRHTGEFCCLANFYSCFVFAELDLLDLVLCQFVYPRQISDCQTSSHGKRDAGEEALSC